jgi:hypothetical protein
MQIQSLPAPTSGTSGPPRSRLLLSCIDVVVASGFR